MSDLQANAATVLITGGRDWDGEAVLKREIGRCVNMRTLIEGDARGADKMAGEIVLKRKGIRLVVCPAQWDWHGKAAGPIRNAQMLKLMLTLPKPHLVMAFHDDLESSRGTKHMVGLAQKAGVPVMIFTSEEEE